MIFIGVDPGLTGAIGCCGERPLVYDMPTRPWGKSGKKAVDLETVRRIGLNIYDDRDTRVLIERVGAMPGQGVTSMFSLGMSMYGVAGVFAGMGFTVRFVEPRVWKAYFKLGADKDEAREIAMKRFPKIDLHLKKHHGRAEALLIAQYAMETWI